MQQKPSKRKVVETVAGAAIGAAIAGPIGAVAGGLAANQAEAGLQLARRARRAGASRSEDSKDDPLIHARLKRILVPIDFSPRSMSAVRFAKQWAPLFGAKVWLLHVVEPITAFAEVGTIPMRALQRDVIGKAKTALQDVAREEFPASIRVDVAVRTGKAFEEVVAVAREIDADLIIIATHGYTGVKHALLGSTAERVVRHAMCPVLTLRRSKSPGSRRKAPSKTA